jgi:hypothetical protein
MEVMFVALQYCHGIQNTGCTHTPKKGTFVIQGIYKKNGAISKVIKEFISHPIRAQHTLAAAETV